MICYCLCVCLTSCLRVFSQLFDWLIGWLIDWFIHFFDWLTDWVHEWVNYWLVDLSVSSLIDWFFYLLIVCLNERVIAWLTGCVTEWLFAWLIDWSRVSEETGRADTGRVSAASAVHCEKDVSHNAGELLLSSADQRRRKDWAHRQVCRSCCAQSWQ